MLKRKLVFLFVVLILSIWIGGDKNFAFARDNLGTENTGFISLAAAQTAFLEYGEPQLMYIRSWNSKNSADSRKLKLVYALPRGPYFNFDFKGIDAVTAKPLTFSGKEFKFFNEKLGEGNMEYKQTDKLSTGLTEVKAKELAVKKAAAYGMTIDNSYNYESHYNENWLSIGEKVYQITFTKKAVDSKQTINVVIDIDTGDILRYYYYNKDGGKNQPVNKSLIKWTEGKDKAVSFAKSKFPEYAGNTVIMQNDPTDTDNNINEYYYSFWRTEDGIIYPENNIMIIINALTGEVTGYGYRWENFDFPNIEGNLIPQQEANRIFINEIGISLITPKLGTKKTQNENQNPYYRANASEAAYIDCYTGKLKNSWGQEITKK